MSKDIHTRMDIGGLKPLSNVTAHVTEQNRKIKMAAPKEGMKLFFATDQAATELIPRSPDNSQQAVRTLEIPSDRNEFGSKALILARRLSLSHRKRKL